VPARTLRWDGCCNIRDLGGLPTEDGAETRFRELVRADNITLLSEEGQRALAASRVRRIVDLRFDEEVDRPHSSGIDVVHVPLVRDAEVFREVDKLLAGMTEPVAWRRGNYLAILDRAGENFARAATAVARAPDGAVLVHCAGGADRTGLVVALLLCVAGVGVDTIAADYAESEQSWAPFVSEWIKGAADEDERAKRRLLSVMPAEAMRDVLLELESRYGGAREYLIRAGAAGTDLDRVRERLRG
jgi:protein-tyrosine phosphatase